MGVDARSLLEHIRDIPDFPRPGVTFKDLTPLWADPTAFRHSVDQLVEYGVGRHIDKVVGVEARGFVFAAPVAHQLGAGFVPARKPGKLPAATERQEYELEYGTDALEVHRDALAPGEQVLIVDDVLATGGTARAAAELVERLGATVAGMAFVIELRFLGGRARIDSWPLFSVVELD